MIWPTPKGKSPAFGSTTAEHPVPEAEGVGKVELRIYEAYGWNQVSIELVRPDGTGHGHRIFGPKFDGTSVLCQRIPIDARTAKEMRKYLDMVEDPDHRPQSAVDAEHYRDWMAQQ